jgi:hypothetical protein
VATDLWPGPGLPDEVVELRRHAAVGEGAGTALVVIMTVLTPVSIIGREPCPHPRLCPSPQSPTGGQGGATQPRAHSRRRHQHRQGATTSRPRRSPTTPTSQDHLTLPTPWQPELGSGSPRFPRQRVEAMRGAGPARNGREAVMRDDTGLTQVAGLWPSPIQDPVQGPPRRSAPYR